MIVFQQQTQGCLKIMSKALKHYYQTTAVYYMPITLNSKDFLETNKLY
jgi:hypothetical protein